VDFLRSCYRSTWRFPEKQSQNVKGYYFFCDPGTPHYPGWSYFGSRNWHKGDGTPIPPFGELETVRQTWRDGSFPVTKPDAVLIGDVACIEDGQHVGPQPVALIAGLDIRCWAVKPPWGGLAGGGGDSHFAVLQGGLAGGGNAHEEAIAGGLAGGGKSRSVAIRGGLAGGGVSRARAIAGGLAGGGKSRSVAIRGGLAGGGLSRSAVSLGGLAGGGVSRSAIISGGLAGGGLAGHAFSGGLAGGGVSHNAVVVGGLAGGGDSRTQIIAGGLAGGGASTFCLLKTHRRQSAQNSAVGILSASVSLTWGTATTIGDALVVVLCAKRLVGSGITFAVPAGWSITAVNTNGDLSIAMASRLGAPSQTTTGNFTATAAAGVTVDFIVLGAAYSNPSFVTSQSNNGTTGTATSPTFSVPTQSFGFNLIVGGYVIDTTDPMSAPTNGFSLVQQRTQTATAAAMVDLVKCSNAATSCTVSPAETWASHYWVFSLN